MEGFQPPPLGSAVLVAILLTVGNVIVIVMMHLCANGTIERGGLAGVRTAATRSSDAAWRAGHVAARRVTDVGNGLAAVLAASTLLAASTVVPYLSLLAAAGLASMISVGVGVVVAHRAAERQLRRDGGPQR